MQRAQGVGLFLVILLAGAAPLRAAEDGGLASPALEDRLAAVRALAERGDDDAVEALARALGNDPAPEVRAAVVAALAARLPHEGAATALETARRQDPVAGVREAASAALAAATPLPSERSWHQAATERWGFADPDARHGFYTNTAYGAREGEFYGKGFVFGHWQLRYGLADGLDVGGQVTLPVFLFHVGGHVRYAHSFHDYLHLAGVFDLNFIKGFDEAEDILIVHYGGGPSLSIGPSWLSATLALPFYGFYWGHREDRQFNAWAFVPSLSLKARVHRFVSLLLELHVPVAGDKDGLWGGHNDSDLVMALLYGIRLHGEQFYGDIGFVLPVWDDDLMVFDFMPMGWPIISFGFSL